MMKWLLAGLMATTVFTGTAQVATKLQKAFAQFAGDAQMLYGQAGICVMDANTGAIVFESNSNTGFAPASTQKTITSIAAFDALGAKFQYKTRIGYSGTITGKTLQGDLIIEGSGDPTLGSWRFAETKPAVTLQNILAIVKKLAIDSITGNITTINNFELNPTPDYWSWGDMGNYYGAGFWALNWNENQFDLYLKTGSSENAPTSIVATDPADIGAAAFINEVKTGKAGTGDGTVIYFPPFSQTAFISGAAEPNQARFKVSGAASNGELTALQTIEKALAKSIFIKGSATPSLSYKANKKAAPANIQWVDAITSPTLDSMIYWFLHKSINLYGEALVKTIGNTKKQSGTTDKGLEWISDFYEKNGIDTRALHMMDGSGLSATNRLTPKAMAQALLFAKKQSWYPAFYEALPLYNGMKLKSGTIHRVKSFAGYHGNYIVSFLVNNYNGSTGALVNKMYKVLDELK